MFSVTTDYIDKDAFLNGEISGFEPADQAYKLAQAAIELNGELEDCPATKNSASQAAEARVLNSFDWFVKVLNETKPVNETDARQLSRWVKETAAMHFWYRWDRHGRSGVDVIWTLFAPIFEGCVERFNGLFEPNTYLGAIYEASCAY